MKKYSFKVSIVIVITSIFSVTLTKAQNTGISYTAGSASTNAVLDLNSGNHYNMGLIIPYVSLNTNLAQFSPPMASLATTKDTGMIVYNVNASAGSGVGYYYWNASSWVRISNNGTVTSIGSGFGIQGGAITTTGTLSIDTTRKTNAGIPTYWAMDSSIKKLNTDTASWHIGGNSNIVDGTYFLGTTNNIPLNFEVNGSKSGRIDPINYNTYLGYQSGNSTTASTTGAQNVGIGYRALYTNTSGSENTATGYYALEHNTGSYNTATGYLALEDNTSGNENTATGAHTFMNNTSGSYNNAVGYSALNANTTGNNNTAMGEKALSSNTTSANTAFGAYALYSVTTSSGNTATGYEALYSNTGGANTGNGYEALYSNTTGSNNTAVGYQGGYSNTTGSNNTTIGCTVFHANTAGSGSTANGYYALYNSTGDHNTALGDSAGYNETSGTNNTYIGYNAKPSTTGYTNATAIGNGATVTASNTAVIGNSSLAIFTIGGGSFAAPVQESIATTGTVTVSSPAAQILNLSGTGATSLTIVAPSSPVEGQIWIVTTNQSSITITSWTGGSFASAPSTIGATSPARFFYSTSNSGEWKNF